jgi:hypothetical protein
MFKILLICLYGKILNMYSKILILVHFFGWLKLNKLDLDFIAIFILMVIS